MENQVTTVVCPNCGATTSNLHNCDYCGSFLVQKASTGVDLSDYVKQSEGIANPVLEKLLGRVFEIKNLIPSEALNCVVFSFEYPEGKTLGCITFEDNDLDCASSRLSIDSQVLDRVGCKQKLIQSNIFPLFTVVKDDYYHEDGSISDRYCVDFGKDAKGAVKLLVQIIEDIFKIEINRLSYTIETDVVGAVELGEELYDGNGFCTDKTGLAKTDYKVPSESQSEISEEQNGKRKKIVWTVVGVILVIIWLILDLGL